MFATTILVGWCSGNLRCFRGVTHGASLELVGEFIVFPYTQAFSPRETPHDQAFL